MLIQHTTEDAKFAHLQPGIIAEKWSRIVRIVKVGSMALYGYLPHCMEYEVLGWTEMRGRWWEEEAMTRILIPQPYRSGPYDYFQTRADRIYFSPFQGRGLFYGTPKARQMAKLIERWRKFRWDNDHQKRIPKQHADLQRLEDQMDKLLATKAGQCPSAFSLILPPEPNEEDPD